MLQKSKPIKSMVKHSEKVEAVVVNVLVSEVVEGVVAVVRELVVREEIVVEAVVRVSVDTDVDEVRVVVTLSAQIPQVKSHWWAWSHEEQNIVSHREPSPISSAHVT